MLSGTKLVLPILASFTILSTSAALAGAPNGFAGSLSGDYLKPSCSGCGGIDAWGISGSGAYGLGMNDLAVQGDAGYHRVSGSGVNVDLWNVGGSAFWAGFMGRLGANLSYASLDTSGANGHVTGYGGFGEYYPTQAITVGLNAGGFSAGGSISGLGSASSTGSYVGGGATGYLVPDFAASGLINYISISGVHFTTYGGGLEYLFSESLPISIYGGYSTTEVSGGGGHINQWSVGFKFYTNGNGVTLVDRHRNGTLGPVGIGNGLQFAF
jgi:hypothetical protein